jgi:cephalosporin-C deacetylase-like acetyl esterase
MRYFARTSLALLVLLLSPSQSSFATDCAAWRSDLPHYSELTKIFSYDQKAPLHLKQLSSIDKDGVAIQSIEFTIGGKQPCSAMLAVPKRRGPLPAVIWLGSGDKDWTPYASEFSKLGAISLVPDNCGNAPASDAHGFYNDEVHAVIELRRGVDLLVARGDVDPKRIAFVGHSGGAMLGADAVAVDGRFKAAVFESGLQGFTYHICSSPHPYAVHVRAQLGDALQGFITTLAPLDAILYVGHEAPTALLFQSARMDKGVPQSDAQAFFDAASQPKQIIWYDTGHEMKLPQVSIDRTDFLKRALQMSD